LVGIIKIIGITEEESNITIEDESFVMEKKLSFLIV
jgi:hypothetical protein